MTRTPKWWSENGPPSPTTPITELYQQVQQDKTTSECLRQNRFYELDMDENTFLHKHELCDGTVVFSMHPTISALHQVLKTTKKANKKSKSPTKKDCNYPHSPPSPPHIKNLSDTYLQFTQTFGDFIPVPTKKSTRNP